MSGYIQYTDPDGKNFTNVSAAAPLPVDLTGANGTVAFAPEPDGTATVPTTSVRKIWSDDFGDGVIDATKWQVLPGGDSAHGGSGTMAVMAYSVGSSALSVTMGTTASDELWLMSLDTFSLPVDMTVLISKSQELAANLMYAELVEVDPVAGTIYDNAALAGEPRNRVSLNAGGGTVATTTVLEAIGDGTGSIATVTVTTQTRAASAVVEYMLEARAEDSWLSSCSPDTVTAKTLQGRLSTQSPNNNRLYKVRLRFKNNGTPATSTTIKVYRALIADMQEQRVEVTSGRGDTSGAKGLPVNATLQPQGSSGTNIGVVFLAPSGIALNGGSVIVTHLLSAATTNATLIKATAGRLVGGVACNTSATAKYLKFFNKTTAPVPGTDTPTITILIPPGASVILAEVFTVYGLNYTGFGFAITGAAADLDATAVAAGDVVVSVIYI